MHRKKKEATDEEAFRDSRAPRTPRVKQYQTPSKPRAEDSKATFVPPPLLAESDEVEEEEELEDGQILEDAGLMNPPHEPGPDRSSIDLTGPLPPSPRGAEPVSERTASRPSRYKSPFVDSEPSAIRRRRTSPPATPDSSLSGASADSGLPHLLYKAKAFIGYVLSSVILFDLALLSRHSKWKSTVVIFLILGLIAGIIIGLSTSEARARTEQLNDSIRSYIDSSIGRLRAQRDEELDQKINEIFNIPSSVPDNANQINAKLHLLNSSVIKLNRHIDDLRATDQALSKQIDAHNFTQIVEFLASAQKDIKACQDQIQDLKIKFGTAVSQDDMRRLSLQQETLAVRVNEIEKNMRVLIKKTMEELLINDVVDTLVRTEDFKRAVLSQISNETIVELIKQVVGPIPSESLDIQKLKPVIIEWIREVVGVSDGSPISDPNLNLLITKSLDRFAADRIGKPDFALASAGAKIVRSRTSPTYTRPRSGLMGFILGLFVPDSGNQPSVMLNSDNTIGNCWAFHGAQGHVAIKLAMPLIPESFSLEHIDPSIAYDFRSCPKEFRVWGLHNETDPEPTLLGSYTYLEKGGVVQTFPLQQHPDLYPVILLDVLSNYGHPDYTCIYRFRVHGKPTHIPT